MSRKLQERQCFESGITTEWGPSRMPEGVPSYLRKPYDEREWRALVRYLNKTAKEDKSYTRFRSVPDESEWS